MTSKYRKIINKQLITENIATVNVMLRRFEIIAGQNSFLIYQI